MIPLREGLLSYSFKFTDMETTINECISFFLLKVLERIKNLSNHVTVQGSWSGEMTLSVKTELVTTKTYFTELDIPQLDSQVC